MEGAGSSNFSKAFSLGADVHGTELCDIYTSSEIIKFSKNSMESSFVSPPEDDHYQKKVCFQKK
jgi:hypothetical protein